MHTYVPNNIATTLRKQQLHEMQGDTKRDTYKCYVILGNHSRYKTDHLEGVGK